LYKKTEDLLKKFEQEYEVYIDARDQKVYWMITAKMPKKTDDLHNLHREKQYISGRDQGGTVLIIQNPQVYENYTIEQWGPMDTFDDFVSKAISAIKEDIEEWENDCKTSCD
jgi:hypothetical protein